MDKSHFQLSESDKYYIEQNITLSRKALAKAIGKSIELIDGHLLLLQQKEFENSKSKKKGESPVLKKMQRHGGATALTKEALIASEESAKARPYSFKPLPGDYGTTKQ